MLVVLLPIVRMAWPIAIGQRRYSPCRPGVLSKDQQ